MDHLHNGYTDQQIADAYRNERLDKQLQELKRISDRLEKSVTNDLKLGALEAKQVRSAMSPMINAMASLRDVQLALMMQERRLDIEAKNERLKDKLCTLTTERLNNGSKPENC